MAPLLSLAALECFSTSALGRSPTFCGLGDGVGLADVRGLNSGRKKARESALAFASDPGFGGSEEFWNMPWLGSGSFKFIAASAL